MAASSRITKRGLQAEVSTLSAELAEARIKIRRLELDWIEQREQLNQQRKTLEDDQEA